LGEYDLDKRNSDCPTFKECGEKWLILPSP
jgi:hypothetical protein